MSSGSSFPLRNRANAFAHLTSMNRHEAGWMEKNNEAWAALYKKKEEAKRKEQGLRVENPQETMKKMMDQMVDKQLNRLGGSTEESKRKAAELKKAEDEQKKQAKKEKKKDKKKNEKKKDKKKKKKESSSSSSSSDSDSSSSSSADSKKKKKKKRRMDAGSRPRQIRFAPVRLGLVGEDLFVRSLRRVAARPE